MSKQKILVVDDNITEYLPLIKRLQLTYDVSVATSLSQAVHLVEKHGATHFQGYIIDLELPITDVPYELEKHIEQLKIAPLNAGQALAKWLRGQPKGDNAKYLLFTANRKFLDLDYEKSDFERLIEKGSQETTLDNITDTVTKRLGLSSESSPGG